MRKRIWILVKILKIRERGGKKEDTISLNGQIKKVKDKYKNKILNYRDVVGIGIGKPVRRGKEVDELAIIVSVVKKLPKPKLTDEEMIPSVRSVRRI